MSSETAERLEVATAGPQGDPLLEVRDLSTRLHTARGDLFAVDGVNLTLQRGETLGIVGESGSGKSVLGRTIMGLHTTDSSTTVEGQVLFEGRDVQSMTPRELRGLWGSGIGMVFQDPMTALNPVKRVGTHISETLREHRSVSRAQARKRTIDLLDLVGIPDPKRRVDQFPHEMSGGMRQRVVIAMALVNDPALLIADEPTTALDVTVQRQILDLLDRLQAELGMAVILISHNLGVVAGRADRVAVMYAGRFAEAAPSRDLFESPRHPYTHALLQAIPRLGAPPHVRLAAIDGAPPDMVNPPAGCRFAPRCAVRQDDCGLRLPHLAEVGGPTPTDSIPDEVADARHEHACFHPITTGAI